jgi:hypothetical protein
MRGWHPDSHTAKYLSKQMWKEWYGYREREGWGSERTNGSKGSSVKNIGPVTL